MVYAQQPLPIDSDSIFPFHSFSNAETIKITKFRVKRITKGYAHFMRQLVLCKQMTNESIFFVKENYFQREKDDIMGFEVR